jgi:hypothetical protein
VSSRRATAILFDLAAPPAGDADEELTSSGSRSAWTAASTITQRSQREPSSAVNLPAISVVAGQALFAEYIGDYLLALAFGIVFQYFAIAPMRGLGLWDGLKAAVKADFISLTFFEIGLFGWMALMAFVFFPAPHHLMPNSAAYWFIMQIGMVAGFLTSWPANVWLINRGIKVPM